MPHPDPWSDRISSASRFAVIVGAVIAVVGVIGHFIAWPLITAALGPTVYVFAAHPDDEMARVRNALVGHSVGIGAGLASLAAFGLWNVRGVGARSLTSWTRIGAVVLAIGLTLFVLELMDIHHAPAGATSLLVSTGLAGPGPPLYGLVVGLAVVILVGPIVSRQLVLRVKDRGPKKSPNRNSLT